MTPKEKAKELVEKFKITSLAFLDGSERANAIGKNCALLAVGEILLDYTLTFRDKQMHKSYEYWQKVKKEIEQL
jgi:ABC-type uncharacterized transport system ATPase component